MSDEEEKVGLADGKDIDVDDARNLDENTFNENNNLEEDSLELQFSVLNPAQKSGHIVYLCNGVDEKGPW